MSCILCRSLRVAAWCVVMVVGIASLLFAAALTLVAIPFILLLKR